MIHWFLSVIKCIQQYKQTDENNILNLRPFTNFKNTNDEVHGTATETISYVSDAEVLIGTTMCYDDVKVKFQVD